MNIKKCVLLILLCVCCLFGCASQKIIDFDNEETDTYIQEITLMHVDANKESFIKYIAEAEEKLDIKINLVQSLQNADNRHAQISTILSSGDSSVDIIGINDEMMSEFKSKGYLEPLNDIMNKNILSYYPIVYMQKISMLNKIVYSVPYMMDIMVYWVNDEILEMAGLNEIKSKKEFDQLLNVEYDTKIYGYGGAWEESYVYNEIIQFVNMFGGDYLDWENENNRIAMEYLYNMIEGGYVPKNQLLDQYDQMQQKFLQGLYGSMFMYSGSANTLFQSDVNVNGSICIEKLPEFMEQTTNVATWQYILNSSSQNKQVAKKFLDYAASKEGQKSYCKYMNVLPARLDVIYEESLDIPYIDVIRYYIDNVKLQPRQFSEHPMRDIRKIGELFCKYVTSEISLDEFCVEAQKIVNEITF